MFLGYLVVGTAIGLLCAVLSLLLGFGVLTACTTYIAGGLTTIGTMLLVNCQKATEPDTNSHSEGLIGARSGR